VQPGADLSRWNLWDSYDAAAQCRAAREQLQRLEGVAPPVSIDLVLKESKEKQAARFAECIASHDPRLKEK
jgi:hypothetical protein